MLALLLGLASLGCHLIQADWIYGRDLSAAVPQLSTLTPEIRLGLSPVPGTQRVFSISDLKRIALANHVDAEFHEEACFTWKLGIPDPKKMADAMRRELAGKAPQIEIVESSMTPAPEGEINFPLSGLTIGSEKATVWRGYVQYSGVKKFPIWARAVVKVKEKHVVAAADLKEGELITDGLLKTEIYEGPVRREHYVTDVERLTHLRTKRPIPTGTAILEEMTEAPLEVTHGDVVSAIVQTGAARLEVQAIAEMDGRKGQIIPVRNTRSGRTFHGRVEDKGVVIVVPGGQFGLVLTGNKS
jgi:flagella basal body P-ring formation protein FlgA